MSKHRRTIRQRAKRANHLPFHQRPKLVEVREGNVWVFRPRVLRLNQLSQRWKFHKEKSEWKAAIAGFLRSHANPDALRHRKPVRLSALYFEPTAARDPSNIDGGAMKALLDALVECGILVDDGWKWIKPPHVYDWVLDKADPRVELTIVGV